MAPRVSRVGVCLGVLGSLLMLAGVGRAQDLASHELMNQALAATPDLKHGADLFERHCVRCHQSRGSGMGERQYPQLAGQQRQYLLNQLVQIIAHDRFAPKMHQVLISNSLDNPQALSDLSAYLAAQPHDSHGEHGDAHRLGRGRALYEGRCAQCHGALGTGQALGAVPAISGQNYSYLVMQLRGFAAGHRWKADSELVKAMTELSADDISAVADFMSRLPQSADSHYGKVL